jgi:hypothetical protein
LAAAAIAAIPAVREPVLRAAGWALVVKEPLAPVDIIVVSPDSGGAGALEAADLVQSGIATRVAVFADPPSGEDHEFIRRGLPYEDEGARQVRQLGWLGVTDVLRIPRTEVGTEGIGQVLPPWCDEHQFRSIVFVAAADHSRRLRRVLDRAMKGHATGVTIRPRSMVGNSRWDSNRTRRVTEAHARRSAAPNVILTSALSRGVPGVLSVARQIRWRRARWPRSGRARRWSTVRRGRNRQGNSGALHSYSAWN